MNILKRKIYSIEKETTKGFLPVETVSFRFFARRRAIRRVRALEKVNPGHEYQLRFLGLQNEEK